MTGRINRLRSWRVLFPLFISICVLNVYANIIPPYTRCHTPENQFFASGDFIYWSAWQDQLEYTWKLTPVGPSDAFQRRVNRKLISLENSWDIGCRLAVGIQFDNGWDTTLTWSYFQTQLHGRTEESSPILATVYIQNLENIPLRNGGYRAEKAIGSWNLVYNTFDFSVGYEYYISPHLHFHPRIGLNAASIDQTKIGKYQSVFKFAPSFVSVGDQTGILTNDAWGIGPKFGFESYWHIFSYFQLLGEVSGCIPWMCVDESIIRDVKNDASKPTRANYKEQIVNNNQTQIWPYGQLAIGINWNHCFSTSQVAIDLQLKYEVLYWWMTSTNNLGLQGITFSGRVQF